MRYIQFIMVLFLSVVLSACSGGNGNPIAPSDNPNDAISEASEAFIPATASDVLYSGSSRETAYKAFGIYQVILDPKSLTAQIIPSRKSQAIGMTFDSDLTQFLTVSPCTNCLGIYGVRLIPPDQVEIGFAVKHPFADITKRPDLHGFDVRGIVLAKGNWNFPLTLIQMDQSTTASARANVSLVANPDGYTHHFDELASDPNYFDPPRNYDANINPFIRYFVNGAHADFDPHNPSGYNVMKVGVNWEVRKYIFNIGSSPDPIDFGFIVDCSYGQSATFQNRTNPYYFLPEFNRKEAWKVDVTPVAGKLLSGDPASSVTYWVSVCDWQAGLTADPNYPDIANLDGIKAKSDVAQLSIEIPAVSSLVENTIPISGTGTLADPYIFNLTAENSEGATAGWYYGIVAVRDDLQGQQGPIAIPETPAGFPYAGPEIYDYSTYQIFKVRVFGSKPNIVDYSTPTELNEGDNYHFNIDIDEPDGDAMTYHWEQVSPSSPVGLFVDAEVEDPTWQAPPLYDVPITGVEFQLKVTVTDDDGWTSLTIPFTVLEKNGQPQCLGIWTNPFFGIIDSNETMDLWAYASDPEGDNLTFEWDLDWDGDPLNFDIDATGPGVDDYSWPDQGFFLAACRVTEMRANPLNNYCSRVVMQKGIINNSIKVDNSDEDDPGFFEQDVCMVPDSHDDPVYHVAWVDHDDNPILYCNNADNPRIFGNYQIISPGPSVGWTTTPKITGVWPTIHVIWTEIDESVVPAVYRLKINSSVDGGYTFGALGGERTIVSCEYPDIITNADICFGYVPGLFYLVFADKPGTNFYCKLMISTDGGETWHYPTNGGEFCNVFGNSWSGDFTLKVSGDGIIHVFWRDDRGGTWKYFYDWSIDNGETWNSELSVTNSPDPSDGSMAIDDSENAYFAWTDSNGIAYFRKTNWGTPPTLLGVNQLLNLGSDNFHGTDIWVSPSGETVIIPVMYDAPGYYEIRYNYSFISGSDIGTNYFTRRFGPSIMTNGIVSDGSWLSEPNRYELFSAWTDNRTSLVPLNDHIWGEYAYFVERF